MAETLLRTAQFDSRSFPAHGEVTLQWQGRILFSNAMGPFNVELVHALRRAVQQAGGGLPADRRYVELIQVRHSVLMSQDCLDEYARLIQWVIDLGVAPMATVLAIDEAVEGRSLVLPRLLPIWRASRPVHGFTALAPAMACAQQVLAEG